MANGIIAHDLAALGSRESHCLRSPTLQEEGQRGTWSLARPTLAAHQLHATAMWNARQAVYSAPSLVGEAFRGVERAAPFVARVDVEANHVWPLADFFDVVTEFLGLASRSL